MLKKGLRKYKRRRRYGKKGNFAKKVLAVVNKKAEAKKFDTEFSANITYGGLTTWNLLSGITQGTSTSRRIGDKIYVKGLRLCGQFNNVNFANVVQNSDIRWRMIVFRGKYDYALTSYPSSEVFENNSGGTPASLITSPLDTNQITPLYDQIFTTPASNYTGQIRTKLQKMYLSVNKSFTFREDDSYQKTSNLYFGVIMECGGGPTTTVSATGDVTVNFTDV